MTIAERVRRQLRVSLPKRWLPRRGLPAQLTMSPRVLRLRFESANLRP